MATNLNTVHVNSFTKGMNTDTALDKVSNEQYVFGLNIRITSSALINALSDSNNTKAIVSPVYKGYDVETSGNNWTFDKILATSSIENVGVVIVRRENKTWAVFRADLEDEKIIYSLLFDSGATTTDKDTFSIIMNKELEDVINVYIADGDHNIMLLNILDDSYNAMISGDIDNIMSGLFYYPIAPYIGNPISGKLKTQQLQYCYRFYKKYGVYSKLSPLTRKYLIIDPNRSLEEGNAEDTETSIGLPVIIPISTINTKLNTNILTLFDHILIYRLSYIKYGEDAEVNLIYDGPINSTNITISDVGQSSAELTISEFSALNSLSIVPQSLELNQQYLFASNIVDNTKLKVDSSDIDSRAFSKNSSGYYVVQDATTGAEYKYNSYKNVPSNMVQEYSGINIAHETLLNNADYTKYCEDDVYGADGEHVSWRFVCASIPIHSVTADHLPPLKLTTQHQKLWYLDSNNKHKTLNTIPNHSLDSTLAYTYEQYGINMESLDYENLACSSLFRSLKREDVYRYGIIYYDKYGNRSDVNWIGDVRTPTNVESNNTIYTSEQQTTAQTLRSNYSVTVTITVTPTGSFLGSSSTSVNALMYGGYTNTVQYATNSITINGHSYEEFTNETGVELYASAYTELGDLKFEIGSGNLIYTENNKTAQITGTIYDVKNITREITSGIRGYGNVFYNTSYRNKYNIRVAVGAQGVLGLARMDVTINFVKTSYKSGSSAASAMLYSIPLGLLFNISVPKDSGIQSYQIVRCAKTPEYSRILMQCATAIPMIQTYQITKNTDTHSPLYPSPFLSSNLVITTTYNGIDTEASKSYGVEMLFSPEIYVLPEDSLSKLKTGTAYIDAVSFAYARTTLLELVLDYNRQIQRSSILLVDGDNIRLYKNMTEGSGDSFNTLWYQSGHNDENYSNTNVINFKSDCSCDIYMYNRITDLGNAITLTSTILAISDSSVPNWEDGYSNIQLNGDRITAGTQKYKSFTSIVRNLQYDNWVCEGNYNLRIHNSASQVEWTGDGDDVMRKKRFVYSVDGGSDWRDRFRDTNCSGWEGPGPQVLLAKMDIATTIWGTLMKANNQVVLGSLISNVTHSAKQFAGNTDYERQLDIYYGFGNYGLLKEDGDNMVGSLIVFDGDVYNLPCELESMFKTYNFQSKDTLPSALVVNYVPLETPLNVFFDYGMNYRNTNSKQLMMEPGEITGVASQDRPLFLYNKIYSDNNSSNDIYNAENNEDEQTKFPQRIHYSSLKTNGSSIDEWTHFAALDYIDADTRYGNITHLDTQKDTLYFWQTGAFGKISVNERSLVTDNNNNTVQLGQGGVLQRVDYLSTTYGMREQDRASVKTDNAIFWIDTINKAIVAYLDLVVDYGQTVFVLNIINERWSGENVGIFYDLYNGEVSCKMLTNDQQLILSPANRCATSVYTRSFESTISFNNTIYTLQSDLSAMKINNNTVEEFDNTLDTEKFLSPTILSAVVNDSASVTKVFDNQLIAIMKKLYDSLFSKMYFDTRTMTFETNIGDSASSPDDLISDREGNIQFAIPRIDNAEYGNRLRGKWMKYTIEDSDPKYEYSISHILTKFRQSFA